MWIDARLVLGKIDGVRQFTNIMIQGTGTHQLCLGTNLVGYLASEVCHLNRVVEGAGSYLAHLAHQFVVGIGELNQCDVAGKAEGLLYEVKQGIGKEHCYAVYQQVVVNAIVYLYQHIRTCPVEGQVNHDTGNGYNESRLEQL